MSSPLGCHVCGRIPLSRRPPCQGRQVGECASALLLMLFKLSQVVSQRSRVIKMLIVARIKCLSRPT